MNNHIKTVKINSLGGRFTQTVNLSHGLNIISGANGTGKTEFLKFIQQHRTTAAQVELATAGQINVISFSPKRNAQKLLIEQAQGLIRQDANAEQNALNALLNQQMQDDSFQTMKSISEYLALSANKAVDQQGKTREQATVQVKNEFHEIIKKVFDYEINISWNSGSSKYISSLLKDGEPLQFNQLSSGENAIISLIFAIFYARESANVYLIDEPEVHLNWQLEEKLFEFLNWFAEKYEKQLIIVTHSRVCFVKPFSDVTKFFVWDHGTVTVKDRPDSALVAALSGDIVKIISGITAEDRIVYVEDAKQKKVVEKIAKLKSKKVEVIELGNCEKVKTQAIAFKSLQVDNVHFLVDGDNKKILPAEIAKYHKFLVQLDKYCIENYFLNMEVLTAVDKNTPKKIIADEVFNSVKEVSTQQFVPVKALLINSGSLTIDILDRLDASAFIKNLAKKLGFSDEWEFIDTYIDEVNRQEKLEEVFPEVCTKLLS